MRRTRPVLFGALVAAMLLGLVATSAAPHAAAQPAAERITRYDVAITVERDGVLRVIEDIAYDFGRLERHGIFRDLVTRQRYDDTYDRRYRLDAVSVSATPSGTPAGYVIEELEGGISRIKIGDANRTITGAHTYHVEYRLTGTLNAFDDHDELYWNVIGLGWSVPIERASISVQLPGGSAPTEIACFAGPFGSSLPCDSDRIEGSRALFAQAELGVAEGVTIVVGMPKGVVTAPTPDLIERWSLQRAFTIEPVRVTLASLLLAAVVAGVARIVWLHGRDVRWRGAPVNVVFGGSAGEQRVPLFEGGAYAIEYTPVDDLRPGQIGTLLDEVAHPLDVTASIIDLAARGHLHIEEIPKEGWFGTPDWRLLRQHEVKDKRTLLPYEQLLLDSLFETGDDVLLSSLKTKFYTDLAKVQEALYKDTVDRGWFARGPQATRQRWAFIGVGLTILAVLVLVAAAAWTTFALVALPLPVGAVALLALSGRMPSRTAKGTAALRRTLGFRQFIETAETRRAEFAEKAGLFYEYLPFAVVFGCVDRWAKAFEGLALPAPDWYVSSHGFTAMAFADSMDGFSTTTAGTLVSTPGGSGSSGFSGGSSGGGGGGGGGGSW